MGVVEFRRAGSADAPVLTRIAHAAKRHWRCPEEWILQWKGALTVSEELCERAPVFCAVRGDEVLGFFALSGEGEVRELEHFWVAPDHLGHGVGTRMFEQLLLTLRDEGARTLRITSDPNAEGFYRRMGARRVADVPSIPAGRRLPVLLFDLRTP